MLSMQAFLPLSEQGSTKQFNGVAVVSFCKFNYILLLYQLLD